MAAATITAANVKRVSGRSALSGTYGATITKGMPLYMNASTGRLELADASAVATATAVGVALNTGDNDDIAAYAPAGATINAGFTTTEGILYCVGATAGEVVPFGDLLSDEYATPLYVGNGTAEVTVLDSAGLMFQVS